MRGEGRGLGPTDQHDIALSSQTKLKQNFVLKNPPTTFNFCTKTRNTGNVKAYGHVLLVMSGPG